MTPERFWTAVVLFHVVLIAIGCFGLRRWRQPELGSLPAGQWLRKLAWDAGCILFLAAALAAASAVLANLPHLQRLRLGSIVGRLLGQCLFGEVPILAAALCWLHGRQRSFGRAAILGTLCAALAIVGWDGFVREPHALMVRYHGVGSGPTQLRILHITDIQTPSIGAHEEEALARGLAAGPDLIVLTGDYVQNALGRPTEAAAASDLRALMKRLDFDAPLGVFATEGDVGPACADVFAGTTVRCLVDASTLVPLPDGDSLAITGLSRNRGRERDAERLLALIDAAPAAEHRLVISHAPDFADRLDARARVDLVLAGHTHGGQVVMPFFGPIWIASRLPRRYGGGLHELNGIPLHVSRGVGMERGFDPPVRFLCPPEICVLDLRLSSARGETVARVVSSRSRG